jgi:hypothetical protein
MSSSHQGHNPIRMLVWAKIDSGIAEHVRYLMELPGVLTHTSCEGGGCLPELRAYVMVTWDDDEARARIVERYDLTEEGDHWGYARPRRTQTQEDRP